MPSRGRQRVLQYACDRLGRATLAARLEVSEALVESWLAGTAMPIRKQLELANLIDRLEREGAGQ